MYQTAWATCLLHVAAGYGCLSSGGKSHRGVLRLSTFHDIRLTYYPSAKNLKRTFSFRKSVFIAWVQQSMLQNGKFVWLFWVLRNSKHLCLHQNWRHQGSWIAQRCVYHVHRWKRKALTGIFPSRLLHDCVQEGPHRCLQVPLHIEFQANM